VFSTDSFEADSGPLQLVQCWEPLSNQSGISQKVIVGHNSVD
jgi:hypothetical protein